MTLQPWLWPLYQLYFQRLGFISSFSLRAIVIFYKFGNSYYKPSINTEWYPMASVIINILFIVISYGMYCICFTVWH